MKNITSSCYIPFSLRNSTAEKVFITTKVLFIVCLNVQNSRFIKYIPQNIHCNTSF